jgi:hypothetical protein
MHDDRVLEADLGRSARAGELAGSARRAGADLGIEPGPSTEKTTAPVCLPMNTSRADALRTLNAPLGEP